MTRALEENLAAASWRTPNRFVLVNHWEPSRRLDMRCQVIAKYIEKEKAIEAMYRAGSLGTRKDYRSHDGREKESIKEKARR